MPECVRLTQCHEGLIAEDVLKKQTGLTLYYSHHEWIWHGRNRNASIKSLYYTGNYNADLAAGWLLENQGRKNLDGPIEEDLDSDESDEGSFPVDIELYKMVFIVNMELGMGVGKTAAQVAHASLALYRILIDDPQRYGPMLMSWEQFGETKIVVKGNDSKHLEELEAKAKNLGLPNFVVRDAGKTQIAAGSHTVLGMMGKLDVIDSVTGLLQLL
ncbi:hypothetical protein ScPMuIL_009804 [Solemya velum]